MSSGLRSWLNPARPPAIGVLEERAQRRAAILELVIVFAITLGLSGLRSLLSLIDSLLRTKPLNEQAVAIVTARARVDLLDLFGQLLEVTQLVAWGALGLYLLYRGGMKLTEVGLDRAHPARDLLWGAGMAALIGIPGLAFYYVSWQLGFSLAVRPAVIGDAWWRSITLILSAFGNAFAEEVLVIGYLLTRLRQLGVRENSSLLGAAVLRGSYHLYQGFGGFVGNLIMGLVFGRIWQRTNRLWPLVIAHTLLDVVAFLGYALLRDTFEWLP